MDEAKREWIQLWLCKATSDLQTAQLIASAPDGHLDAAAYHCQQAAEKAVKGFLSFIDLPIQKTHDLEILIRAAIPLEPRMASLMADAVLIMPYATRFRYPSDQWLLEPSRSETDEALAAAQRICDFVLSVLPPETHPT